MDFQNVSGDPNYEYLEPSISEAVIKALKKNFVFDLFEEKEWRALAKKNFFFEDSFHTPTIGMQMGLLGRQDIVIGGGFTIQGNRIITKVHILGMAEKKILKAFDVTGYADNRIWDSVNDLANTIADITKDVLPNEKEWNSFSVQGKNQITLSAYISPISVPDARTAELPSAESFIISPNDFNLVFKFSADYMRYGIFLDNLAFWGNFSYTMGTRQFEAEGHDSTISVEDKFNAVYGTMNSFHITAGAAYRVFSKQSFYITPRLGIGFYYSTIDLDFSYLTNPPGSTTGSTDVENISSEYTGISLNTDLILGYQLLEWLTVELLTQYQHVFFSDDIYTSNVFFALNMGFKF